MNRLLALVGFVWAGLTAAADYGNATPASGWRFNGNVETIGAMDSIETDPTKMRGTSLRLAAREGRYKEVERLISERHVDPNADGEFGETALMMAARYNHPRAIAVLLAHGANPDAQDSNETTALQIAAQVCAIPIAKQLIGERANVNLPNRDGQTALHFAFQNNCPEVAGLLIASSGIDLNRKNQWGYAPMDYALEEAQTEVGGPQWEVIERMKKLGGHAIRYFDKAVYAAAESKRKKEREPRGSSTRELP